MPTEAVASRLWVLSDLHLAPPGELCVFQAHEGLTSLIDHLAACPVTNPPQWLVLNGDVFDYLLIPGYNELDLTLAVKRTGEILDALDAEPPARNVVQALRRLTARGHKLSCMPGNHDAELNLAPVQEMLLNRLGSTTEMPPWNGEWRLEVAGHDVVGRHGHHGDAFNAISAEMMLRAQADGDEQASLPPGSRLVLQVINPFRRSKSADGTRRFPFIDSLPSEQAVLLAIMLLDPQLAAIRLPDALRIGAAALLRKALRASGLRRQQLSGAATEQTLNVEAPTWLNTLGHLLGEVANDLEPAAKITIEHEVDAYFAGAASKISGEGSGLLAKTGGVRGVLLEALSRSLKKSRSAFRSSQADALAKDAMETWGQGQIAVTGHTHAARSLRSEQGSGAYINTGTWIDQVVPPEQMTAESISDWLDSLRRGDVPRWSGRPVARVDEKGPHLLSWDGQGLQTWVDPIAPEAT